MSRRTILVCYFRFRINFLVRPQHWLSISRTSNKYSLPPFMNEKKVLRDSYCKFGTLFKSFCALQVNIYLQNMSMKHCLARFDQKRVSSLILCAAGLPASLVMHVPISVLHTEWQFLSHFSMSFNSQCFLQFSPSNSHIDGLG